MEDAWGPQQAARLLQTVRELQGSQEKDWEWNTFATWLRRQRRLDASTLDKRLRQLRFMSEHAVAPVKLRGPGPEIVESFCNYVATREELEGFGLTALGNDFAAFRLLCAFLGLDPKALPAPPKAAEGSAKELLPAPEEVHRLLMWHFVPGESKRRSYRNALVRHLLATSFAFGMRPPSELQELRLDFFDQEHHVLTVRRDKMRGRIDRLFIEPAYLCHQSNTLSLANWLKWRDHVDPERREAALFLRPNGEPFASKEALGRFLWKHVPRSMFPWWHPYVARHWCATARLIEWDFDYVRVANWLGHGDVEELRATYDRDARLAKQVHGGDWLYRAFYGAPRRASRQNGPKEGPRDKTARQKGWTGRQPYQFASENVATEPSDSSPRDETSSSFARRRSLRPRRRAHRMGMRTPGSGPAPATRRGRVAVVRP